VHEQQLRDAVPGSQQILAGVLARAGQMSRRLHERVRHRDRRQLPRHRQPRQPLSVPAIAASASAHDHALEATGDGAELLTSAVGLLLHVGAMVAVMAVVAVVVYEKVGVAVLRQAWINLDAVWAGAFVLAGVLTLFT
jgi:hypothetical protein